MTDRWRSHDFHTERRWRWTLWGSNCNSLFILYLEFVSGQFCVSPHVEAVRCSEGRCWVSSSPQRKEHEHCFLLKQRIKVRVSKTSRLTSVMCHRLSSQRPEVSTCWNRKWFSGLTRRVDGLISELIGPSVSSICSSLKLLLLPAVGKHARKTFVRTTWRWEDETTCRVETTRKQRTGRHEDDQL